MTKHIKKAYLLYPNTYVIFHSKSVKVSFHSTFSVSEKNHDDYNTHTHTHTFSGYIKKISAISLTFTVSKWNNAHVGLTKVQNISLTKCFIT